MAKLGNISNTTHFGVVYTTPSALATQVTGDASKLEAGKLYFASGDASGMIGQGLYIYDTIGSDADGQPSLSLFGSGTLASAVTPGLLSPELYNYISGLSNGVTNVQNAAHATSADNASTAAKVAQTLDVSIAGENKLTYDGSVNKTIEFVGSGTTTIEQSVNGNVLTITVDSSNTEYIHPVSVSGTTATDTSKDTSVLKPTYGDTITVVTGAYRDASGHISKVKTQDLTLPSDNNSWRAVKVNGTEELGSATTTDALDLSAGANIKLGFTNNKVTIDTSGVPTTVDMNTAISDALSSLFKYEGEITSIPSTSQSGCAYRASAAFTLTATHSVTEKDEVIEIGDVLLCTNASGPKFTVIQNNITNNVSFSETPVNGQLAMFDGTTGTVKNYNIGALETNISEAMLTIAAAGTTVTDSSSIDKAYLLGHTTLGSKSSAKSNSAVYMQDGELYSNNSKVALVDNIPSTLPNANALNIKAGSVTLSSYTGSAVKNITLSADGSISFDASTNGTLKISSTDSKVSSAANHYAPAANDSSKLTLNASSDTTAEWGVTDMITGITLKRDEKGHIVDASISSIQMPANPNSDTNVATSASTAKLFIVGKTDASKNLATAANYNANVYIGTDNCLYSNNVKVATINDVNTVDTAVYWEVLS